MSPGLLWLADQYTEQATSGDWPARIALIIAVLVVTGLAVWGMRVGWRHREQRQAWLPELAQPSPSFESDWSAQGRYVATTTGQDWLDRVVARGLGAPGQAEVHASDEGVLVLRVGEPDLLIPFSAITGVESRRGLAQEVYERDGMVAVLWTWGEHPLCTGLRMSDPQAHTELIRRINQEVATKG